MHTFHERNVPGGKQPGWNLPGGIFQGGICRSPLTHDQLGHLLVLVAAPVPVLQGLHDVEADGLVAALLDDGRRQALVHAAQPCVRAIFNPFMPTVPTFAVRETLVSRTANVVGTVGKNGLRHKKCL